MKQYIKIVLFLLSFIGTAIQKLVIQSPPELKSLLE